MKNVRKIIGMFFLLTFGLFLVACGGESSQDTSSDETQDETQVEDNADSESDISDEDEANSNGTDADMTIKLGAHSLYEPIAEATRNYVEEQGYELEIEYLSDNQVLNEGLNDGTFDFNFHQHGLYMQDFNESRDGDLAVVNEPLFRQLIGLFSLNINDISEIQENDMIAIQNDPTNTDRAMKVLSDAGLIELDEQAMDAGEPLTELDIVDNPMNLQFEMVEGPALVQAMEDTVAGVITGVHIAEADFTGEDALATYTRDDVADYDIILAGRTDNADSEKAQVMHEALQSDEAVQAVEDTFKGSWIPTF